ncbi:MAG: polysaccharide pyruvyl transferase family protein [Methanosarcinales archaeon]|nr:polysaccharide pyruvyl transferase family protein [Methanosarcinales archaeon]
MTEKKPMFILAGNGPYDNRGCEAIVRGTVKILRHYYNDPSFLCISHFRNEEQFKKQCSEEIDNAIIHKRTNIPKILTVQGLFNKIQGLVDKNHTYKDMLPYIEEAQAVLSVGGDNYSLDYGIPRLFTDLDDIVMKKYKTMIIWGASVGPFSKNPKYEEYMINHLQNITAIFVRESATFEYLTEKGLVDNVFRIADPAFLMDPIKPKENELQIEEGANGINLSPLMSRYVTGGDINKWTEIAAKIVSKISEATSRKIYLIPHVTNPHIIENDYAFLKNVVLKTNCRKNSIVLIPPIYNAAETKWIISQMKIFAGARTHSTIAALSSCVPTLSFAYSIKAQGINNDIFGDESYCLNPNELKSDIIVEKIQSMIDNSSCIEKDLHIKIPKIQNMALLAGKHLHEITQKRS